MHDTHWHPYEKLTPSQRSLLDDYRALLLGFNQHHNLISRDSEADVDARHLVHALCLAWKSFPAGSTVVDWGTGGGLPAIPLAIRFPDVCFVAVDSVEKKIQAVQAMARRLGLGNIVAWHGRAEAWPGQAAYSVSRATAPLRTLWSWHARVCTLAAVQEGTWLPGLVCLKGGDLREEVAALRSAYPDVRVNRYELDTLLGPKNYANKCIVAVS